MGVLDAYENHRRTFMRVFRRIFRRPFYFLIPDNKLSPLQRFVRDGLNSKIYSSVPRATVSEVLVFGGYLGASVDAWLVKNPFAKVQTYEPVSEFAEILRDRFPGDRVTVHQFGVGMHEGFRTFLLMSDSTSGYPSIVGRGSEKGTTVDVRFETAPHAAETWPAEVDVAEINIEGGEYELISALSQAHLVSRIRDIFVQFHDVGPETSGLLEQARRSLALSHRLAWRYDMVWEHWTRLDVASNKN